MEVYATALRLSSTLVVSIGCFSHALVLALNWPKMIGDSCGSFLMIEVMSLATIIRLFTGWLVIYRTQTISSGETVFFSYGLCGLIDGQVCGILHAVSAHLAPLIILCIPIFMAMRTFILFGVKPMRGHVAVILIGLYCIGIGILVQLLSISIKSSTIFYLPPDLWSESKVAVPYVEITQSWQSQFFFLASHSSVICAPITYVLKWIMVRKMNMRLFALSPKTQELHHSFVGLLTFDVWCLVLGIAVSILRFLSNREYVASPLLATILSAFNFPILLSMPAVQGLATLYYVPYMRKTIIECCAWKSSRIHDGSSE